MASHDQVAHNWAHQTGRAQRGFNMFYDGPTIYSYGHHFPIARIVTNDAGDRAVLFTTDSRSVSTAKHKTITSRACHHMTIFHTAFPRNNNHAAYMAEARQRFADAIDKARRATRYTGCHIRDARRVAAESDGYVAFFGLDRRRREFRPIDTSEIADGSPLAARAAQQAGSLSPVTHEAKIAKALARLDEWRAGAHVPYLNHASRIFLRLKGAVIETSRGAAFPASSARALWPDLSRARRAAARTPITPADKMSLGGFRVDKITKDGIQAGCHFVDWQEAEAMAETLGLV